MSNERDRIEIYIREDRDVSQRLRLVIRLKHESAIIGAWFEHGGHHRLTLTTNVTISVMFTLLDAIKRTASMESERGHLKALRWTKLLSAMETGEQMGGDDRDVDLEKAFLDPGSMFATPEQLHDYPGLTREQKIEILRRWAYDASELAVAEEEGMVGGEPSHLARIVSALHALTDGYDVEHSPPRSKKGCEVSSHRGSLITVNQGGVGAVVERITRKGTSANNSSKPIGKAKSFHRTN